MDAISPRARRNKGRTTDKQTAQWTQECLLGRLNDKEEPLSPENVAAIKGSGSFYDDNGCIDARTGKCLIRTFLGEPNRPEGARNTEKGAIILTPPDHGYNEEKNGARNIDLESMRPNSLLIPSQEKEGVKNADLEFVKSSSPLFCEIPFALNVTAIPRVQTRNRENRFGGDDDYANNFENYTPQQPDSSSK
jgi:hypothetical protein